MRVVAAVAALLLTAFAAVVLSSGGAPARGLFTPLTLPRGGWQPRSIPSAPWRFQQPKAVESTDPMTDMKVRTASTRVTKAAEAFGDDVKAASSLWIGQLLEGEMNSLKPIVTLTEVVEKNKDDAKGKELDEAMKGLRKELTAFHSKGIEEWNKMAPENKVAV